MRPPLNLALYLVTDESLSRGRPTAEIVAAAIRGGADVIQLRAKDLPVREQLAIGRAVRAITREAGVLFIVNDRTDLALALDADGIHVGQDDLPADIARQLVGPDRIVGVSTATVEEARIARNMGSDYLGVGAIYGTATKSDAGAPIGPAAIGIIKAAVNLPVVGIGGIGPRNAAEVIAAGAAGVAVVSAIVAADDPEAAARSLKETVATALRR
jgi:thiamine-phosphate pyrophosphorylase